mmetsp:Transcript_54538/g.62956  ORF Transcript_54538/g.62956 Transcript_54538/m.62956 type:complete len:89 (+) Transcript_54538:138-404(+)
MILHKTKESLQNEHNTHTQKRVFEVSNKVVEWNMDKSNWSPNKTRCTNIMGWTNQIIDNDDCGDTHHQPSHQHMSNDDDGDPVTQTRL